MGKIYQVVVSTFWGRKTVIDLGNTEEQFRSMTVLQLKEKNTEDEFPGKSEDVCMIFVNPRMEDDDALLSSYGIQHLSAIMLVLRGGEQREQDVEENVDETIEIHDYSEEDSEEDEEDSEEDEEDSEEDDGDSEEDDGTGSKNPKHQSMENLVFM
uniref:Ubiquitin-like domain-containing protein n=1 Tax=Pundamilia nyererei TaxID=303518 RepID=A0A3B4H624_9CICH